MKTAKDSPSALAFKQRDIQTGTERVWTYSQYLDEVRTVAKSFISLGLDRFQSVCILGFNSPEWVISDLAAIFAGGIAAGKKSLASWLKVSKFSKFLFTFMANKSIVSNS